VIVWSTFFQFGVSDNDIVARRFDACRSSDANGDTKVDVTDVFYDINALFAAGAAPVCGGDANGDGKLDVADVFYLINYLFAAGPPPIN